MNSVYELHDQFEKLRQLFIEEGILTMDIM